MRQYYVYIMSSKSRNLYIGVTNDLERRVYQHVHNWSDFTARYRIHRLVYYEVLKHPMLAINREKELKGWTRARKIRLISSNNPAWDDLAEGWFAV